MPKRVKVTAKQERKGIAAVQNIVVGDLEWIFREQPSDDFGIDAQIEVVENETATGRLIAVQIKSGPSYFKKIAADGWWFRLKPDDLEYWLEHALPVVLVLYEPATGVAHWEAVTPDMVVTSKSGGKKILIPNTKRLGDSSRAAITKISEGKPYELRIRKLRLALPWMKLLLSGRRILLEADEWVNKTSGRGDLQVVSVDEANGDRQELGTWYLTAGLQRYEDVLPSLMPWADAVLHHETYDEHDLAAWESDCVRFDNEGDYFESEPFEDWHTKFDEIGLRPYSNSSDEVDHWRLELVLNDLGKGFLAVDEFAEADTLILTPLS